MVVSVYVGTQFGDEGKGKIVDYMAHFYGAVARYAGGDNAGHTVVLDNKTYKFHLIPSGILHPNVQNFIGRGLVVNPRVLLNEIRELEGRGFKTNNLWLSQRANVIMPYHIKEDEIRGKGIGTTGRGIGPAYTDKVKRTESLRIIDLLNPILLEKKLGRILDSKASMFKALAEEVHGKENREEILDISKSYQNGDYGRDMTLHYIKMGYQLAKYVVDVSEELNELIDHGYNLLLEGAQGTQLGIDSGLPPFVTSSNPTAGYAATGVGIGPTLIDEVIGVAKAYTTRVGNGPFPTEEEGPLGEKMREKGNEYGTTTGRERRCGWLDLVLLKYANQINGLHGLALTKVDVLGGFPELKVCVAYKIDGTETTRFPAQAEVLKSAEPVYKTYASWGDLSSKEWIEIGTKQSGFPNGFTSYVELIEREVGVPVKIVSVGPERESTFELKK